MLSTRATQGELERDLAQAAERSLGSRIVIEPETPSWVEAERLLRGWHVEPEFRLVLDSRECLPKSAALTEICIWGTPEGRGVIEDVFVDPKHRGQGIATALVSHAVLILREGGAGRITIPAEVGDTPVQLYARLGFRPGSVERSYVCA